MQKIFCPRGFFEKLKAVFNRKCLKLRRKLTKIPKIQIFQTFMQFLSNFRLTGLKFKDVRKENTSLPVDFCEQMEACVR